MANSRESLLQEFVDWSAAHIRGDEKGEAQIFLDRLFVPNKSERVEGSM
jgi:hypothetical protein